MNYNIVNILKMFLGVEKSMAHFEKKLIVELIKVRRSLWHVVFFHNFFQLMNMLDFFGQ
jgi:hypothetical protein